jgi:dTDP-4-amino-4,6-dideoxygalactose transaminase
VNRRIAHNRPLVTDDDRRAVDEVLRSGWIAHGPEVAALERDFDDMYERGGSCAVSSGTAALFVTLRALGVGSGDRVAVPTYSCSALLNAVFMAGAEPLVVDVLPADFNLDPTSLERMAGRVGRPAVTVAAHCYGAPANVADIAAVGPKVIEDCCQSLGGIVAGRPLGDQGEAAVFSFYATKIVTCGHGGLLRDPGGAVAVAARDFRDFDVRPDYRPRFNLYLTDFQAAMARSQLRRLASIAERRRYIAARYTEVLPSFVHVDPGVAQPGRLVYRFVITLPDAAGRETLRRHLADRGISTIVPVERFELLHRYLGLDPAGFPVAEALVDTTLSLPVYPGLTDAEVQCVCDALEDAPG